MTFKAFCSPYLPLPSKANFWQKLLQNQQTSGKESEVKHEDVGQGCAESYHLKLCINTSIVTINELRLQMFPHDLILAGVPAVPACEILLGPSFLPFCCPLVYLDHQLLSSSGHLHNDDKQYSRSNVDGPPFYRTLGSDLWVTNQLSDLVQTELM